MSSATIDINELYTVMSELLAETKRTNELLAKEQEQETKPYLSGAEVCSLFGWTNNQYSLRKLKMLREARKLTRFGSERPYSYERNQAQEVARKLHAGELPGFHGR